MRLLNAIVLITCLLLIASRADQPKSVRDRVLERQASIAKMKEHDRAEAYAKLALDLAELAYEEYNAGDNAAADKTIAQVSTMASKAYQSAKVKHKKIKEAEINLRRCSVRLDAVRRSLSVSDQEPVKQAIAAVDKARADVLEAMFAK